ncbi:MAG: type II toxin-antitoxin system VapC family toxin [Gemmatimonadales bacterium]
MILYAESSAIVAWLFDEPEGESVRQLLEQSTHVLTSQLTPLECRRALQRGLALGRLQEAQVRDLSAQLARSSSPWIWLAPTSEALERAGNPFPVEPIRTLDALHLASALVARNEQPDIEMLSLDDRVRENAHALGFPVRPA